jgi:hypothetical protein
VGGGAWPFLVGGVICLVNSDNERDSVLLNSPRVPLLPGEFFLEGLAASSRTRLSNNRSVMPLDVLGRTRATLKGSACLPSPRGAGNPLNPLRGRDRGLQLFPVNQEFPVSASHKLALITSLPFVHTARRYYRLNVLVRYLDLASWGASLGCCPEKTPKLERLEEVKVVTRFP